MEKINQSIHENFAPVELFIDDIKFILSIFSQACDDITIHNSNYQFNSVEDLLELDSVIIHHLIIETKDPYISISFFKNGITIFSRNDEPFQRGIVEQLKKFLSTKKRKYRLLFSNPIPSSLSLGIGFFPLTAGLLFKNLNFILLGIIIFFLAVIFCVMAQRENFKRYSKIHLKTKKEHNVFLQRNKEQILTAVISAIIGAIITVVINNYASNKSPVVEPSSSKEIGFIEKLN